MTELDFLLDKINSRLDFCKIHHKASDGVFKDISLTCKGEILAYTDIIKLIEQLQEYPEIPQFEGTREQLDGLSVKE